MSSSMFSPKSSEIKIPYTSRKATNQVSTLEETISQLSDESVKKSKREMKNLQNDLTGSAVFFIENKQKVSEDETLMKRLKVCISNLQKNVDKVGFNETETKNAIEELGKTFSYTPGSKP